MNAAVVFDIKLDGRPIQIANEILPARDAPLSPPQVDSAVQARSLDAVPSQTIRKAQEHGEGGFPRRCRIAHHVLQRSSRLLPSVHRTHVFRERAQPLDGGQRRAFPNLVAPRVVGAAQLETQRDKLLQPQHIGHLDEAELGRANAETVPRVQNRSDRKIGALHMADHLARHTARRVAAHQHVQRTREPPRTGVGKLALPRRSRKEPPGVLDGAKASRTDANRPPIFQRG